MHACMQNSHDAAGKAAVVHVQSLSAIACATYALCQAVCASVPLTAAPLFCQLVW